MLDTLAEMLVGQHCEDSVRPRFQDGEWVRFCGTAYEVIETIFVHGRFHYYLNDGTGLPHHEDSLRSI